MRFLRIIWDDEADPNGNVQHVAEHGLEPTDVEFVIEDPEAESTSRSFVLFRRELGLCPLAGSTCVFSGRRRCMIDMIRVLASLLAIGALLGSACSTSWADENSKLTFTQDGKDLVVSTTVTVNNSSHVLWTHAIVLGKDVHLQYFVFQNRDLLVRSKKPIGVKWRLAGRQKGDETYHVENSFLPSSPELKELLPQLQKLMEEGQRP